jgi:formylglycine-generating enzyme required for sulfatase activity
MALIPGGTTKLATREDAAIAPFCLDITEVTVGAYTACVQAKACVEPNPFKSYKQRANDFDQFCNWKNPGREMHPVNCIDYRQANAYCTFATKRLPSDPEWEWAARNGHRATAYPWGNEPPSPDRLNACDTECASTIQAKMNMIWNPLYGSDDGWPGTAPVGTFPRGANRWGVMDLAGNVAEWTSTPDVATAVARGGSWISDTPDLVRSDMRVPRPGPDRTSYIGVRCAKNVP